MNFPKIGSLRLAGNAYNCPKSAGKHGLSWMVSNVYDWRFLQLYGGILFGCNACDVPVHNWKAQLSYYLRITLVSTSILLTKWGLLCRSVWITSSLSITLPDKGVPGHLKAWSCRTTDYSLVWFVIDCMSYMQLLCLVKALYRHIFQTQKVHLLVWAPQLRHSLIVRRYWLSQEYDFTLMRRLKALEWNGNWKDQDDKNMIAHHVLIEHDTYAVSRQYDWLWG